MPLAGFEPGTPESERTQTHALDRAATDIEIKHINSAKNNFPFSEMLC
jgi:hypothetical protein